MEPERELSNFLLSDDSIDFFFYTTQQKFCSTDVMAAPLVSEFELTSPDNCALSRAFSFLGTEHAVC